MLAPTVASQLAGCAAKTTLRILILGGTSFLGPHQIAYALERGHSISTFTRGRTEPSVHQQIFGEVEQLIGDRENDLEALRGKTWDAVIDNSGQRVKWTRDTAQLLKDSTGLYLYTSSTGVYYPYLGSDIKEDTSLVLEMPSSGLDEVQQMEYGYGVMKANSELEVLSEFGADRSILVRPTYMMGPADQTDRFTYWPVRLERGGDVLVPGAENDPVQYIDVRDVAEWMIRLIEQQNTGTFNAVGPDQQTNMSMFVNEAKASFAAESVFTHVNDFAFLKSKSIFDAVPWIMPEGENYGSARVNNARAIENGLTFRPLNTSVTDIYEWWTSGAVSAERMERLTRGQQSLMTREADVLREWRERS